MTLKLSKENLYFLHFGDFQYINQFTECENMNNTKYTNMNNTKYTNINNTKYTNMNNTKYTNMNNTKYTIHKVECGIIDK